MDGKTVVVDLRSDTVTLPTKEMREAMANAEVGDDVFGEDPTVNRLQQTAATMFGKEDALFVPTGTMGNLVSAMSHCWERSAQVIVGDKSHMNVWEQGGVSQIGGISTRVMPLRPDGTFSLDDLMKHHRTGENFHHAKPALVCVENPVDGKVLSLTYMKELHDAARTLGLKIHLDGARVANAIVALQCKPTDITMWVDSANICLSKGLGAPVGSVIVGNKDFIERARRLRKVLGGGMRQCGILAAAGLVALTTMMKRQVEDHDNAKIFARGVLDCASDILHVDLHLTHTNMVRFYLKENCPCDEMEFTKLMAESDDNVCVKILPLAKKSLRAMFHNGVSKNDVILAIEKLKKVCGSLRQKEKVAEG